MKFRGIRLLLSLLRPFAAIARELRILRELYEADLASRERPIYRLTEKPNKRDTEVMYAGVSDTRPLYKRWFQPDDIESDEDDVQS